MEGCRQLVGGGNSHILMTEEVKRLGQDERQKILLNAGLKLEIPSEMGLAMKADLALPWNKLREIRRYTSIYGLDFITVAVLNLQMA